MKKGETRPFKELADEVYKRPGAREEIEARTAGIRAVMKLAELRKRRNMTQAALAEVLKTTQANVSRIERGGNPYLETLEDFVEGIGGRLEINVLFDDEVVPLKLPEAVAVPTPTRSSRAA
jgi:transcriptional regulator with XRE-family HTH domain